jgi:hypothetical protein
MTTPLTRTSRYVASVLGVGLFDRFTLPPSKARLFLVMMSGEMADRTGFEQNLSNGV